MVCGSVARYNYTHTLGNTLDLHGMLISCNHQLYSISRLHVATSLSPSVFPLAIQLPMPSPIQLAIFTITHRPTMMAFYIISTSPTILKVVPPG